MKQDPQDRKLRRDCAAAGIPVCRAFGDRWAITDAAGTGQTFVVSQAQAETLVRRWTT